MASNIEEVEVANLGAAVYVRWGVYRWRDEKTKRILKR
jgi:hypothetical protein